jgi:hypothetical protein
MPLPEDTYSPVPDPPHTPFTFPGGLGPMREDPADYLLMKVVKLLSLNRTGPFIQSDQVTVNATPIQLEYPTGTASARIQVFEDDLSFFYDSDEREPPVIHKVGVDAVLVVTVEELDALRFIRVTEDSVIHIHYFARV